MPLSMLSRTDRQTDTHIPSTNKNDFKKPGVSCQMLCTSGLKTSYINFSITLYNTFIIDLISAAQAVKERKGKLRTCSY